MRYWLAITLLLGITLTAEPKFKTASKEPKIDHYPYSTLEGDTLAVGKYQIESVKFDY